MGSQEVQTGINPRAVQAFLGRPRDSWTWTKRLPKRELLDMLASLTPAPDTTDMMTQQLVGMLIGIATRRFSYWYGPGSGKTLLVLRLLDYFRRVGEFRKGLVLVPSIEAVYSWQDQIAEWKSPLKPVPLGDGASVNKALEWLSNDEGLLLAAYPSFCAMVTRKVDVVKRGKVIDKRRMKPSRPAIERLREGLDAVVFDECFTGDTKISTPSGDVVIANLRTNEDVITSRGLSRIKKVHKKNSHVLCKLYLSNGSIITTTPNHPFFTELGWMCAGNLEGMYVFPREALRKLWKDVPETAQGTSIEVPHRDLRLEQKKMLQSILLSEIEVERETTADDEWRPTSASAGDKRRPRDWRLEPGEIMAETDARQNQRDAQEDRQDLLRPWWERAWADAAPTTSGVHIKLSVENGARHFIGEKAAWLSNLLQSRLGVAGTENGHRNRRQLSQNDRFSRERRKETAHLGGARVDRVEIVQLNSPCNVYTIELAEAPHFFANGFLVHNSTEIAEHTSLQWRCCKVVAEGVPIRFALAGRPFGKDPQTQWAQQYVVDEGASLGATLGLLRAAMFAGKKRRWGGPYSADWTLKPAMKNDFKRCAGHRSLTYATEECVDLPPLVPIPVKLPFPPETLDYYERVKAHLIDNRADRRVVENDFLRMRQLGSGFLGVANDQYGAKAKITFDKNPKMKALLDIIKQFPETTKFIVPYEFTFSGEQICAALRKHRIKHGWMWGGARDRKNVYDSFRKDPSVRVLVMQWQVGAYALNLQMATAMVVYESPVGAIPRDQLVRRFWRAGQKKKCLLYDLIMVGGAEQGILDNIKAGDDIYKALSRDPTGVLDRARGERTGYGEVSQAPRPARAGPPRRPGGPRR